MYLSHIAGPRAFETISAVVAEARLLNARRGISGLLVFDGAQVCQYVEGERTEVEALAGRLAKDSRHEAMKVLHQGALHGPRRFGRWRLGYLNMADGADLSHFHALSGTAAVERLFDLFPGIDSDEES